MTSYAWPSLITDGDPACASVKRAVEVSAADGLASLRRDAEERGYLDGRARAEAELDRERQALMQQLGAAIEQISSIAGPLERAVADEVFAVTCAVAKALVNTEIVTNPDIIRRAIRRGLACMPDGAADRVRIMLHPDDLAKLTVPAPVCTADAAMTRGSVRMECEEALWMSDLGSVLEDVFADPLESRDVASQRPTMPLSDDTTDV